MMETMGKPDKDINESMKHICDVVQKRIDEAYQRGLKDGKEYGLDESDMREAVSYQKGLDDAWETARKIAVMWEKMDNDDFLETFGVTAKIGESTIGALFKKQTANEAMLELEAYEEKQKAEDDKIEVGDEVNWLGDCFIVTQIFQPHNMKEQCCGIDDDGCVYRDVLMDDLEKTGRHFDIASILKEMQS